MTHSPLRTVFLQGLWLAIAVAASRPVCAAGLADLKADYGFPAVAVAPADLGLKPGEVLTMDFTEKGRWQGPHQFDEAMLKLAIQGMLNRSGPRVFLDATKWGWRGDTAWLSYYRDAHRHTFARVEGGLDVLLRRTAARFHGIVLYDPTPSDNIFLALNLANVNSCLPVSQRLYAVHRESLKGLRIVARIDKSMATRSEIYSWLARNVLPRTDRSCAYCPAANFADLRMAPHGWEEYVFGADYAFYRKGFVFNLPSGQRRTDAVDGTPELARLFGDVMRGLDAPAAVFGWCSAEAEFSRYGHHQCCTTAAPNLSFHAAVKPLRPPPYVQPDAPRIAKPEQKVYLAFVANEGDTAVVTTQHYYGGWHDPGRGKLPLNWAINPYYALLFPAMMEYFHRTKTEADYFVCAPSGAGYIHPDRMSTDALGKFLDHTRRTLESFPLREVVLWECDSPERLALYAKLPGLRGLTVKPNGLHPYGDNFFVGPVPVVREGDGHYWQTQPRFADAPAGYRVKDAELLRFLDDMHARVAKPHYFMFYGLQDNLPSELARLAGKLDRNRFEIVDLGTMMHLMRCGGPLRWTNDMVRRPALWKPMNDARVSVSAAGVRVEIAPGKTWAIAYVPELLLPPAAKTLRVAAARSSDASSWIVKVSGRFAGLDQRADWLPFSDGAAAESASTAIDRRVRATALLDQPQMLQLGLTGTAGDAVTFTAVDFQD